MSKAKFSFTDPGCSRCDFHKTDYPERYCHGIPKRRNPKRFRSKDPKYKAPKWCPRRLNPAILRVYRYKNDSARHLAFLYMREAEKRSKGKYGYTSILGSAYKLIHETTATVTAKRFYESSKREDLPEGLGDFELEYGDVIGIDNGLSQHFFYYKTWRNIRPAYFRPPAMEVTA